VTSDGPRPHCPLLPAAFYHVIRRRKLSESRRPRRTSKADLIHPQQPTPCSEHITTLDNNRPQSQCLTPSSPLPTPPSSSRMTVSTSLYGLPRNRSWVGLMLTCAGRQAPVPHQGRQDRRCRAHLDVAVRQGAHNRKTAEGMVLMCGTGSRGQGRQGPAPERWLRRRCCPRCRWCCCPRWR